MVLGRPRPENVTGKKNSSWTGVADRIHRRPGSGRTTTTRDRYGGNSLRYRRGGRREPDGRNDGERLVVRRTTEA